MPAVAYTWLPDTEPEPRLSRTAAGPLVPSPQSIVAVCVSSGLGSDNGAEMPTVVPTRLASAVEGTSGPTDGETFATTSWKLVDAAAPCSSVAVIVTVRLSVGPSSVGRLHDHVPLPLSVTVPEEAVSVNASPSGSLTVPFSVAVPPSETVT